ncbi:MAG: helix-turn-helix domain-containing protein [Syntrophobacteraceae bacterium]|nr:helix-turn-helix domain-containing protein [Syntrophobacteraceae bacterium]
MATVGSIPHRHSASPRVTTLSIFNPGVLEQAFPLGATDFTLLAPGPFTASFALTSLGPGWLSVGDTSPPLITRISCPSGFDLLGFLLDARGDGSVNGRIILPGWSAFAPESSRIYCRTAQDTRWAALFVPRNQLPATSQSPETDQFEHRLEGIQLFKPAGPDAVALARRIRKLWTMSLSGIAAEDGLSELKQLTREFFAAWAAAMPGEPAAGSHAALQRIQLLYKADEYMRQNLKRAITLQELRQATSAGDGALRRAFAEILGLTPMSYFSILRLNGIHQDLMDATPDEATVESLCRTWGYVNRERFTESYSELFGETPAETLSLMRWVLPALVAR